MAQKILRRITPSRGSGKGSSGAKIKSRINTSVSTGRGSVKEVTPTLTVSTEYDLSIRSLRTQSNLLHVGADMRLAEVRGEKLTFSQAARNRGVDPPFRHKYYKKL